MSKHNGFLLKKFYGVQLPRCWWGLPEGLHEECPGLLRNGHSWFQTAPRQPQQGSAEPRCHDGSASGKAFAQKEQNTPCEQWMRLWETALRTQRQEQEQRSRSSEQRHPVGPQRDKAAAGQQHKEGVWRGVNMDWHHSQVCSACNSSWQEISLSSSQLEFSLLFSLLSHWGLGAASNWVVSQG